MPLVYSALTVALSPIATPIMPARSSYNYKAKEGAQYSYIAAISEDAILDAHYLKLDAHVAESAIRKLEKNLRF